MPLRPSLTPKEQVILTFIANYYHEFNRSPTFIEIQKAFRYASVNSVQNFLKQLAKKGYIQLLPHQKRNILLNNDDLSFFANPMPQGGDNHQSNSIAMNIHPSDYILTVPIVATVAAGRPFEHHVFGEYLKWVPTSTSAMNNQKNIFAVQVNGDSMIDANICDGDFLICQKDFTLNNGITAIVSIMNDGATVKQIYFYKQKQLYELRPANPSYQSTYHPESNLRFEGQVIGLIRKY